VSIQVHFLNKQIIHNKVKKNTSHILLFNTVIEQVYQGIILQGYSKLMFFKLNKNLQTQDAKGSNLLLKI
jgi:hypothetical protein